MAHNAPFVSVVNWRMLCPIGTKSPFLIYINKALETPLHFFYDRGCPPYGPMDKAAGVLSISAGCTETNCGCLSAVIPYMRDIF